MTYSFTFTIGNVRPDDINNYSQTALWTHDSRILQFVHLIDIVAITIIVNYILVICLFQAGKKRVQSKAITLEVKKFVRSYFKLIFIQNINIMIDFF